MSKLKSAYELANERMIAPRPPKKSFNEEPTEPVMDFIEIPEFSDRESKIVEDNETKVFYKGTEPELPEKTEEVKVQEPEVIHYDDKVLEAYWNGHFLDYGGFARMNRMMVFGLSNRNVKVKVEIEPYLLHVNKATQDQLDMMSKVDISPDAPKIFGCTVPTNLSHSGPKIIYTMIETSEKVHRDYAGKLNLADEIWTPTEYGKKILQASGVHPRINVIPLGVDVERYHPNAGSINFGPAMRGFKFLSVFRWSYRKGYDILLRAYMEEFSKDDDVSLLLVSRAVEKIGEEGPKQILEDFNAIKNSVEKSEAELPHIALYTNPIPERKMAKVYCSGDAFVLISRGEGFGLPFCEAGACGLPVIASNCSGHSDFLNEDNAYLIDPDGYADVEITGPEHRMAKLCRFYEGQTFPQFNRKAIDKVKTTMRYVFENYDEAKDKGRALRKMVETKYTWDKAIDKVYARLMELSK